MASHVSLALISVLFSTVGSIAKKKNREKVLILVQAGAGHIIISLKSGSLVSYKFKI